jgi:DNA-binding transcriptional regulator YdaS (Cro superfamily)/DsbC/DsbD-like thiol-disulfide interchange protein
VAGSDKTVKVTLVAVATPYVKGTTEASVATRKLGKDIDGVSAKTKGLEAGAGRASGALKGLAIGAGAVAATGLVAFMTDSVKAAGDLQQSLGGVDAVFKDNAKAIHEFGVNSAEAVGLSTNEFNQLITVTGAMLKNKGLQDFTDQSLNLVKVGADLAAQFGGPTSQAVDALNAAMRGESDPIERYGISLNEAAVNAQLAATGIQKVNGKFTEQQKTTARLALIVQQSADAMGTFAREADTLQGQQQRLNAEWANAKAELGTALLPALTDVTSALRDGVDVAVAAGHAWGEIPGPIKAAVAALVIYKLTNDKVSTGVTGARNAIKRMREELALQQALAGGISGGYQRLGDEAQTAGKKVSRTAGALGVASKAARGAGSALLGAFGGPVGIAITGLTVAIGVFAAKHQEAKQQVEDFTDAIKADSGALAANTREAAFNALEKAGATKAAQALGISIEDLVSASIGQADAQQRVNDRINEAIKLQIAMGSTGQGVAGTARDIANDTATVRDALGGQNEALQEALGAYARHEQAGITDTAAQQDFGVATATTTEKVVDQAQAIRDAAQALLDATEAKSSAFDAEIAYQAALDDTSAAIKKNGKTATDNGKSLDLTTEKGRDNATALKRQADEAKGLAEQNIGAGKSLTSVRDAMDDAREAFIKNAEKAGLSTEAAKKMADRFGLTKTEVDNLAKSVKNLPASKQIKIEAETKAAKAALKRLEDQLAHIKNKSVVVTATTRFVNTNQGSNGGRNTAGGSTFADGGHVRGAGTGTSDSIPAWLSNGEYVLRASAVAKYGTGLLDQMNSMRFAEGGAVRYGSRQMISVPSGPSSHAVTNDSRLQAEVVNIVTPDPRSFQREIRTAPYRAKARPGR